MLKFLRKKTYPIGIDLGSHSLKMIQLTDSENGLKILAAAKAVVPTDIRDNPFELHSWYISTIKELLAAKPFKGRKAVSSLPAKSMLIQHMRLPKMSEDELAKALPWQTQEKLPFDTAGALLRHVTACEMYEGDEPKLEIVLMAASRNVVQHHLQLIEHAKLEIDSVNVEACAIVNSFAHLNSQEEKRAIMLLDLGFSTAKVTVAHGHDIAFCRTIPIGAEEFYKTISNELNIEYTQAVRLYQDYSNQPQTHTNTSTPENLTDVAPDGSAVTTSVNLSAAASQIITAKLQTLGTDIRSCLRYHNLMFEDKPVERVIFIGGQAKHKTICQSLAKEIGLPAQIGDPLARIEKQNRQDQLNEYNKDEICSEWAIAYGLSLGKDHA